MTTMVTYIQEYKRKESRRYAEIQVGVVSARPPAPSGVDQADSPSAPPVVGRRKPVCKVDLARSFKVPCVPGTPKLISGGGVPDSGFEGAEDAGWKHSYVEEIKRVDIPGWVHNRHFFKDFPYKRAHVFRDRLFARRQFYDASDVLEGVSVALGPGDDGRDIEEDNCQDIRVARCSYCGDDNSYPITAFDREQIESRKGNARIGWCRLCGKLECTLPSYLLGSPPLEYEDETNENGTHDGHNEFSADANPFAVLRDEPELCARRGGLMKKARTLVKWFARGLPVERDLPPVIECGGLRAAVRQCFPASCDIRLELSFKTISKIEKNCCDTCSPRFDKHLSDWRELILSDPGQVDPLHLERFRSAMRQNVDQGWDSYRRPFIPNGNATLRSTRREGGNWNTEAFSDLCRAELVFSSGKPRVVTMYSSANTALLSPLHSSLYTCLRRKGWLLVGDPTNQHIDSLGRGGDYLSFDYSQATDRIRREYTRAMIEVLIEKAECLSADEVRALDVLSELRVDGMEEPASRGQPMGSVMSFPLLCLINKCVVDLALADLLEQGIIGYKEFQEHRCLCNGDDLLLREVRSDTDVRSAIVRNASLTGLLVNETKSLKDSQIAEVNSTVFRLEESGMKKQKKENVSALWMEPDVSDVLGYALEATVNLRQFRQVVRSNAHILAKQPRKVQGPMPAGALMVCRKDKRIRAAMTSLPLNERVPEEGPIRMVPRPELYDLTKEKEYECMVGEVERVRERAIEFFSRKRKRFRTSSVPNAISFNRACKWSGRSEAELIPLCYARRYNLEQRENLIVNDVAVDDFYELPPGDRSTIDNLSDFIRARKRVSAVRDLPECFGDFVSLEC